MNLLHTALPSVWLRKLLPQPVLEMMNITSQSSTQELNICAYWNLDYSL